MGSIVRKINLLLAILLLIPLIACGEVALDEQMAVEIQVVSPFDSTDGNHNNFTAAYTAFEEESGHIVVDQASPSSEEWKKQVLLSFEENKEPDVLFYFTGTDADYLVNNNRVVSLSEIKKHYPQYASNMKDAMIPVSPADGRQYAVPVNGYWEGLYVNTKVLAACGVEVPGPNYRWDQFLEDCQTIKDSGFVPIACALAETPHYWFEFCVFNQGTLNSHTKIPESSQDALGQNWAAGLNDIKDVYERGFFPADTATITDDEASALIASNQAAFLLDGSWKLGWFESNAENLEDISVTFVPAQGERRATDIIGGLSMGYYITQKAWDDPAKREACVQFVMAMTSDEVVNAFGSLSVTALQGGTTAPKNASSLFMKAVDMNKACTGIVMAVQDELSPEARDMLFSDVIRVASGEIAAEKAIDDCLVLIEE